MTSAVLILPAIAKGAGNALGEGMGWGPSNYDGIPLSTDGGVTTTHWACRTDVELPFLVLLVAAGYDLTQTGLGAEQIAAAEAALAAMPAPPVIPEGAGMVLAALDIDLSEELWGADHTQAAMDARALTRVW
jgi:hypothetical protein